MDARELAKARVVNWMTDDGPWSERDRQQNMCNGQVPQVIFPWKVDEKWGHGIVLERGEFPWMVGWPYSRRQFFDYGAQGNMGYERDVKPIYVPNMIFGGVWTWEIPMRLVFRWDADSRPCDFVGFCGTFFLDKSKWDGVVQQGRHASGLVHMS